MQKYRVFSVRQRFAYPMTIYGFTLAAFVTSPLSDFFSGAKVCSQILLSIIVSPLVCKWRCIVCNWRYAYRCLHSFQSVHTQQGQHTEPACYSKSTWQNIEIITCFRSNLQVQSAIWGSRIQSCGGTDRAYYFCTR